MTFEQLRILRSIVDEGGVIAASKVLYKTQPAVSNAISRLEKELAVQLFSRDEYRLSLSSAGQALYEQMKVILQHEEIVTTMAAHLSEGNESEVRISVEVVSPLSFITTILAELEKTFPLTQFDLTSDVMGGALEKLAQGDVDLVIGPQQGETRGMDATFITSVPYLPVSATSHPSAQAEKELTTRDMVDHVQIILHDTTQKMSSSKLSVMEGGRIWAAADFSMKKQLLVDGLGWGCMPRHLIESELNDGRLVQLNIEDIPIEQIDIFAFKHKKRPLGPISTLIWKELCKL